VPVEVIPNSNPISQAGMCMGAALLHRNSTRLISFLELPLPNDQKSVAQTLQRRQLLNSTYALFTQHPAIKSCTARPSLENATRPQSTKK
jgi:hypothetical protein